jgi:hypothetical protein
MTLWLRLKNDSISVNASDVKSNDTKKPFSQSSRIILGSLTPGKVYMIQARAIGGSTGFSDWSTSVTIMAT